MKHYILIILILLSSCNSGANSEQVKNDSPIKFKTDIENLGLIGKVKVLRQDEFLAGISDDEIGYRSGENSYSFSFDQKGEKTNELYYDKEGLVNTISTYDFSENGRKNLKNMNDANGKPINSCAYEYDDYGRIIRYNITDHKEKIEYYSESKYDDYGNEIIDATYTTDGQKIKSSVFTYLNGRKTRHVLKDHMGTPFAICNYKYNDKGDAVKEIYYSGNNLIFEEYNNEYKYDHQGNWILKIHKLTKKHITTTENKNRKLGTLTITMRTLTYY
jgi:hypothetical protein